MRGMDSRKWRTTTLKDTKGVTAGGNDSLDSRRGGGRAALTSALLLISRSRGSGQAGGRPALRCRARTA